MNDERLQRDPRQIPLYDIGIEGRQRLFDAHAPVIGLGGQGSPSANCLGRAGVGRSIAGRPTLLDACTMRWDQVRIARQPECAADAPLRRLTAG